MELKQTEFSPSTEELLPWHKPEIQRLVVRLDTNDAALSGTDAAFHEVIPG